MAHSKIARGFLAGFILSVITLVVAPVSAQASTVTFNLDNVFNSAIPASSSPYATATFDDMGGTGTVILTITSSLENSNEFFTEFYFNSSVAGIVVNYTSMTGTFENSFGGTCPQGSNSCINQYSSNAYQADGDGLYDFQINFATGNPSNHFDGTDVAVFTITGPGITANTFDVLSAPGGNSGGPFHVAAHVQGIQPNCSGWVSDSPGGSDLGSGTPCGAVPETSSLLLLASGLAGIALFWGHRRFATNSR